MKSSYISPTTDLQPQQRIYMRSLYSEDDVPGKWVFLRLAEGLHTTSQTMCFVQQLPPFRYPITTGIVALDRIATSSWKNAKQFGRQNTKSVKNSSQTNRSSTRKKRTS